MLMMAPGSPSPARARQCNSRAGCESPAQQHPSMDTPVRTALHPPCSAPDPCVQWEFCWVINPQEPFPEGQHILKGGGEEGKGRFH